MRWFRLSFLVVVVSLFGACPADEPQPPAPVDEICDNEVDDDGDGAVDCDDTECSQTFACQNPGLDAGSARDASPQQDAVTPSPDAGRSADAGGDTGGAATDTGPTERENSLAGGCTDGIDNDGDGDVDCADSDCDGADGCGDEDCTDGIDNDGDGMIDCADTQCYGVGDCPRGEEICDDDQDNNGDDLIDCADPLCAESPDCVGGNQACADVLTCLMTCVDDACRVTCNARGDEEARGLAAAVGACAVENRCADLACIQENCGDQFMACMNDMPPVP